MTEDLEHAEAVLGRLAETQNATRADRHPRILDMAEGVEAVLIGVGRDDIRVVLGRGVEVVIVGSDTGLFQLRSLDRAQFTEGCADLHAEFAHAGDDVEDLIETLRPLLHSFPRRAHAEAGRALFASEASPLEDLVFLHEPLCRDAGGVAR